MCKDRILAAVGSLVGAIAVGAFVWTWNANVELRLLRAEIIEMKADRRQDDMQDAHIKSLWRYGAFLHEQVDLLRFNDGLPPANKPKLE
jgi:hypothetical protein